jgi:hypothetical protein
VVPLNNQMEKKHLKKQIREGVEKGLKIAKVI